jgi:hypothetical protein
MSALRSVGIYVFVGLACFPQGGQGFQTRQRLRGLSIVAISNTYQGDLDIALVQCGRLSAANHARFGYTVETYEMAVLAGSKHEKPDWQNY